MMKKLILAALTFCAVGAMPQSVSAVDYTAFSHIPVQHEGRVKPLDTFARNYLTTFYGKQSLKNASAISWLAEVVLDPSSSYRRKIFNIANPDVVSTLGLEWDIKHRYSFVEVYAGVMNNKPMYEALAERDEKTYSSTENQLMDIQYKALMFYDLSRSFSLILPDFVVNDERIATALDMEVGKRYTYLDMLQRKTQYEELLRATTMVDGKAANAYEKELLALGRTMQRMDRDSNSQLLSVIPPAVGEAWVSPWQIFIQGEGSPVSAELLEIWADLMDAYQSHNVQKFEELSDVLLEKTFQAGESQASAKTIYLERLYNVLNLFTKSLGLYILAFVALVFSLFIWQSKLQKAALYAVVIAAVLHTVGLCMRMVIMGRPPVSTLYESVVFVGLVSVVFGLLLERKKQDGVGLFIATILGMCLQFVGLRYAAEGDTLGMLVAVLDTNFWLATHVVTITIGYGCAFVAGVVGHLYLVKMMLGHKISELNDTMKMMLGVSLVALFFCVFGTILGGIWADQSWGRFWGWDPKENGAMLICLWIAWVLHGRIAGIFNPKWFAVAMVFTNVIVALAWFGVNLLNVGLHSYGFTKNIATNLAVFSGAEILFIVVSLAVLAYQNKYKAKV